MALPGIDVFVGSLSARIGVIDTLHRRDGFYEPVTIPFVDGPEAHVTKACAAKIQSAYLSALEQQGKRVKVVANTMPYRQRYFYDRFQRGNAITTIEYEREVETGSNFFILYDDFEPRIGRGLVTAKQIRTRKPEFIKDRLRVGKLLLAVLKPEYAE